MIYLHHKDLVQASCAVSLGRRTPHFVGSWKFDS